MRVEVSEVIDEKGLNPLTVNFENGKICDGLESKLHCKMYKNSANEGFLTAHTSKMLYIGEIVADGDLQYNFLIIRKKTSNKVHLVNLDHVSLRPYLRRTNGLLDSTITGEKVTNAELNKQFGSKRTKRNTEQKERLKLGIENVKEQLEKTVAAIRTEDYFVNTTEPIECDSSYKPPINREASVVENVYVLEDLLPPNVFGALELEVKTILESDDLKNIGLFSFCKQNIEALKENTSEANLKRCRIFVYINYLLKFLTTPVKNMSRKYVLCQSSREIDSHILNNFSIETGRNRTRPMSMRDKSILYVLVLSMLASNYNLNLEALSKDMKIGIKKLQEMSRILGFSTNGPNTVTLKFPLPAPVVTNLKRKKQ